MRLAAFARGAPAYAFVAEHWQAHLPAFERERARIVDLVGVRSAPVDAGGKDREPLAPASLGRRSRRATGAEEAQRWVDERVSQSFDAVFLLPGATVTINVEEEIAIDYRPNGRPVSYARRSSDPYRSPRLD